MKLYFHKIYYFFIYELLTRVLNQKICYEVLMLIMMENHDY